LYEDKIAIEFKIVSLSKEVMELQLWFENPVYISSGFEPDRLQISFFNTNKWLSTDDKYMFSVPDGYFT